jgi:hypothetical protein
MKLLVFAGPTISSQEIGRHLDDAVVLPPPAQGDVLSALERYRPQAMGIIDTAFPRSAWVSEIHYALRSGVAVYGAGGQGALRAVELQVYGMQGCGAVFAAFASGKRSDDAALLRDFVEQDGGFVAASESLVDVTATLQAAHHQGVLSTTAFDRTLQQAGRLHWKERTWDRILLPALFADPDSHAAMQRWLADNPWSLQQQDAIAMLQAMAADRDQLAARQYSPAERSGMLNTLYQRERKATREAGSVPLYSVAHHGAVSHPRPLEVNFNGLNRDIVALFAERSALEPSEPDLEYEWAVFQTERSLADHEIAQWRADNDMTAEELDALIRKNALCRKMHQWMIMRNGLARATGPFLDELRMRGEYPRHADAAARLEAGKEKQQEKFQDEFSRLSLDELLALRARAHSRALPWPQPYSQGAAAMGLTRDELFYELRRETFHREQLIATMIDSLFDGD